MRINRIIALFLAGALTVLFAGCSKKEMRKPSEDSVKASRALGALQEMERAYKSREMDGVLAHVSSAYRTGYSGFASSVRKDMETYPRLDLDIVIERVENTKDEVRVAAHWFGTWFDAGGKGVEGRGNTVFVFSDSQDMPLIDIVGDSPFGVIR